MRREAKSIIDRLVKEGIIRPVQEATNTCAPTSFVPKKNGSLRFVVDFTALNRSIIRPVHTFPSSDQIMQSISSDTTIIAVMDCVSGYFQQLLAK